MLALGAAAPAVRAQDAPPAGSAGSGPNRIMGTGVPPDPRPFTPEDRLLDAVRRGERARVERALDLGVPVETADSLGRSALLLAARDADDLELVRMLHGRGAAVDRADADGRTPLSYAAAAGNLALMDYLLGEGAALDAADRRGFTPLFHAVLADRREAAEALIAKGADVNVRNRFRDTPLMLACAKGYDAMARLLLAHGADRAATDQEGRTAAERSAPGAPACREAAAGAP